MDEGEHDSARLEGKVAIVTGASRGIGLATASALAERGARVALLARTRTHLDEAVRKIGAAALPVATDISDPQAVRRAFEKVREQLGRLDILVNNAALGLVHKVEHASDQDLRAQVDTNFLGMVYCTRASIPLMREAGGGDIVNLSSDSIRDPYPFLSIYAATKAAVETFTQALRRELRPDSIRVTLARAGPTLTDFARGWDPATSKQAFKLWSEGGYLRAEGGILQPSRVAEAIAYAITRPPGESLDILEVRPT